MCVGLKRGVGVKYVLQIESVFKYKRGVIITNHYLNSGNGLGSFLRISNLRVLGYTFSILSEFDCN